MILVIRKNDFSNFVYFWKSLTCFWTCLQLCCQNKPQGRAIKMKEGHKTMPLVSIGQISIVSVQYENTVYGIKQYRHIFCETCEILLLN